MNSHFRAASRFIIAGTEKSGTASGFGGLSHHPQAGLRLDRRRVLQLALLGAAALALPQPRGLAAAPAGPQGFSRGINVNDWFQYSGAYGVSASEAEQLRAYGFDHVRLPFDLGYIGWNGGGAPVARWARIGDLDSAIGDLLDAGLNVILDCHPARYAVQVLKTERGEAAWVEAWRALAERYRRLPQDRMIFEVMNEAHRVYDQDADGWGDVLAAATAAIRRTGASNWILAAGLWDPQNFLKKLRPPKDPRFMAAAQFYGPLAFTHMGATWDNADFARKNVRGLQYPPQRTRLDAEALGPYGDDPRVRAFAEAYAASGWDEQKTREYIERYVDWSEQHGVPLHCTEFGVIRPNVDPSSRTRWLAETRQVMESFGIGWTLWGLSCLFGVEDVAGEFVDGAGCPERAEPLRIDTAVLGALGLSGGG